MEELQRGIEVAGTGIAVVFAALVSLAVVTTLLGRALRSVGAEPATEVAVPASELLGVAPAGDAGIDPMLVAAMAAAVRFVRRSPRPKGAPEPGRQPGEAAGVWRAQGRQRLMASQGRRVRPRNSRQ